MRSNDTEPGHAVMGWLIVLSQWFNLERRLPRLQQLPILLQFNTVNLGPSFDEPLLRLRHGTTETLNGIDGEDSRMILIIGVKMRAVMLPACLDEHADDDAEETRAQAEMNESVERLALVVPGSSGRLTPAGRRS
jgi:hypothetical protein